MNSRKKTPPRFRVGDWVSLLHGPKLVLAQVIEDLGNLGTQGRRLYGVRLDSGADEPTIRETHEDNLEAATEADRIAWQTEGSLATYQTMTYTGKEKNKYGIPKPLYHYLVAAKPGPEPGSGVASIYPASVARVPALEDIDKHTIVATEGGPDAALAKAEEFLDSLHSGLRKRIGEKTS